MNVKYVIEEWSCRVCTRLLHCGFAAGESQPDSRTNHDPKSEPKSNANTCTHTHFPFPTFTHTLATQSTPRPLDLYDLSPRHGRVAFQSAHQRADLPPRLQHLHVQLAVESGKEMLAIKSTIRICHKRMS